MDRYDRDALDELDDMLDDKTAQLEARFQELEQEAELEQLRRQTGTPPPSRPRDDDPLAEMKAKLDGESAELERYLLLICPHCQAHNRASLSRVRTLTPICGRCRQELAFVRG